MENERLSAIAEELFEKPYWLIDFLPRQAPGGGTGRFFAAERFFTERSRLRELYDRFSRVVIKLGCYCGIRVSRPAADAWVDDPEPEQLAQWFMLCASQKRSADHIEILTAEDSAMLTLSRGDLYMTLHSPSEELIGLLGPLAASEGLFLRQPE